jgi:hypothetical protein
MMKFLIPFICLCVPCIPQTALSQTGTQSETRCTIGLDNAPTIRGLKLGQNLEQVKAVLPSLLKAGSNATRDPGIGALESQVNVNTPEYLPAFEGVEQVRVLFLDDRLVQMNFLYDRKVRWQREKDFTSKISELLKLPNAWEDSIGGSILNCDGFFLRAEIGYYNSPSQLLVKLTNLSAEIDRRIKARDEKQRGSFKP